VDSLSFPAAFIFDWDNTLVDSWEAIAEAINHTRAHFGQNPWTLEQVKANCVQSARDSFPTWFGADWQQATDIFYRRFEEVQMQSLRARPGADSLLRWLAQQKKPCFVVSNKNGLYLRREIAALGWDDLFVATAGAQDAPRDKPARDPVDFVLKTIALAANTDVWFVGDSAIDVACARNAGCTPVLIGDMEIAARLSVTDVFSDCEALGALLKKRILPYNQRQVV